MMAHHLVKIKRLQITSVLVVLEALFLTSRIYENLKGLWERHTHRVRDIQVTFSEDYGPSINHSDTEFNGLHPLLATFLSDTLIKYRTEKNNKMSPWFWKEERVSHLKCQAVWWHLPPDTQGQAGPSPRCAHGPAHLSFLAAYPVFIVCCQCKCLPVAFIFQWTVHSMWAGVTFVIPSTESATQSSLAEESNDYKILFPQHVYVCICCASVHMGWEVGTWEVEYM